MKPPLGSIGIEMEGAWETCPPAGEPYRDGSVTVSGNYTGELNCGPYRKLETALCFVARNYPSSVNDSCGLHVHLSMSNGAYSSLMDAEFQPFFREYMQAWGRVNNITRKTFWSRLDGNNQFCKIGWDADHQSQMTCKDSVRYRHWNFCFSLHGTAECRLLPMFRHSATAVNAVRAVVASVEKWFAANPAVAEWTDEIDTPEKMVVREDTDEINIPVDAKSESLVAAWTMEQRLKSEAGRFAEGRVRVCA